VLLVPGYMCNRAVWRPWLLGTDLTQRWNVATVNLEPAFGPIETYVAAINSAIERLRAASGAARVILVCHSMGGLVARAYLRMHGASSVERVITLNTPHAGTMFAGLAHGDNARQMRRGSDTLRALAAGPEPVEFITFASQHDNLIVPRDSQVLPGAETVWFERLGHLAMTSADEVLKKLIEVVERAGRPGEAGDRRTAGASPAVRA
jgi:pimeloyl-ACP methyl ester carboxylesterase